MFIEKIEVSNFRLFPEEEIFSINDLAIPNNNIGSGLNVFVGENGCGKTSILDSIVLPILPYKADSFSLSDFHNPKKRTSIKILSSSDFSYKALVGNKNFHAQGLEFSAGVREKLSKNNFSSIAVTDQKFINPDGVEVPSKDDPALRLSVNNPWAGPRFKENDILFLDKNRSKNTKSGLFNDTRFDRFMESLDLKHIQGLTKESDQDMKLFNVEDCLKNFSDKDSHQFLKDSIKRFLEVSGIEISLEVLDAWRPYDSAFFAFKKDNNQSITLDKIGSGYEMIFSLIFSFYQAQDNKKDLIIVIDEAELHLHPKLQGKLVALLLEFSRKAQIFITTHSPLLVKQLIADSDEVNVQILKKINERIGVTEPEDRLLTYVSANEINFIAFNLATEEYHNELYEELFDSYKKALGTEVYTGIKDFDIKFFQDEMGEEANSGWFEKENVVTIHTHIRNQIHHRSNLGAPEYKDLKKSIVAMRSFRKTI